MGLGVSYLRPYAFQKLTVGQASTGLSETLYMNKGTSPAAAAIKAMECVVSVEDADVRFTTDGTAPTATDGHLLKIGTFITVSNLTAISKFRAYAPTGTATLQVTFYNG